jgi:hypothetical protein
MTVGVHVGIDTDFEQTESRVLTLHLVESILNPVGRDENIICIRRHPENGFPLETL